MKSPVVLKATLRNVALIAAGMLIGGFAIEKTRIVHAQEQVEEVTPSLSTGVIAGHTLIGHRVVVDQVIVADHDMGKLLENLVNLMGQKSALMGMPTYTQAELRAVIDGSRVTPIRIKKQEGAPSAEKK
jgi:hypothetical protein